MIDLTAGGMPASANVTIAAVSMSPTAKASDGISVRNNGGHAYTAASGNTQELSGWHPSLRSSDAETIPSRDRIVARSRDLDRNNGWARGGIDRRVDAVVGSNIWLMARPDFVAMGQTAEWAAEWSLKAESLFRTWANSSRFLCDVERHLHFGGLVRLAYQHYVLDGEACAPIYWLDRGGSLSTSVLILDPDRLRNPDNKADTEHLRGGIEIDQYGASVAYHVRKGHPNDLTSSFGSMGWTRIAREGPTGRPLFVHVFDKRRAHMRRGVGRFAAVMGRMKMLDRYDASELQAAVTNAIFGLFAKTGGNADLMKGAMSAPVEDGVGSAVSEDDRVDFYEAADLTFNGARVAVIPQGDDIKTIESQRSGTNFAAFQSTVLRSIASSLGISYEQLSQDWSSINYSSARTLLNEIWRGLDADRHMFTQSFCTPIYAAVLEEAVARGLIDVPGGLAGFYIFRDALTQCQWIGPGRGYIDPSREIKAAQQRVDGGFSSLPEEAAEQGNDWRQNIWNEKRVEVEREKYGLVVRRGEVAYNEAATVTAENAAETYDANGDVVAQ